MNQIATAMTGNASFPSPTVPIATFETNITALAAAEQSTLTRVKGSVGDPQREAGHGPLRGEAAQGLRPDHRRRQPERGGSLIHSTGMAVKKVTLRNKAVLAATPGPVPGTAHLVARSAGHRSAYEWAYSLDQKTWTSVPVTLQAKTDIRGLTSGTTCSFRVRPVLKTGESPWSQLVTMLVQ